MSEMKLGIAASLTGFLFSTSHIVVKFSMKQKNRLNPPEGDM